MFKLSGGQAPKGRLRSANQSHLPLSRQRVQRRRPAVQEPSQGRTVLLGLSGRLIGVALFMALSGAGLLLSYGVLALHPVFGVKNVQVEGIRYLSRLDILQTAGIGADSNLLTLSPRKLRQELAKQPWVRSATVTRHFPDTIRIVIDERKPQWLALVEGKLFYLDRDLNPFAPARPDSELDLPMLSGLTRADLVDPDEETMELIESARRLLTSLPAEALAAGGGLSEIHLDRVWGLTVVMNDLPPVIRLGFGNFEERWPRLQRVVADLKRRGELGRTTLIDLDAERRAVVRLGRESA